jgi:COMPASS component SWD3
MDDSEAVHLVGQFLKEMGLTETFSSLQRESIHVFSRKDQQPPSHNEPTLRSILDEFALRRQQAMDKKSDVTALFPQGDGCYAKSCWSVMDALTAGANILQVKLFSSGRLLFTSADKFVYTADLPVPLELECPPTHLINTSLAVAKAPILCIDAHPKYRNLAVMGSMDRNVFLVDLRKEDNPVIGTFGVHKKYVTHCLWYPNGEYFVTGSHDKTVCFFKMKEGASLSHESHNTDDDDDDNCEGGGDFELECDLLKQLEFKGAIECMALQKDVKGKDLLVVGCREDNLLHVLSLEHNEPKEMRTVNLNTIDDDFVSFTPMDLSFSPDMKTVLVSTDKDRIILIEWESGHLIANFYGAMNDEFSHPRHCWHPSGLYIYGVCDCSVCICECV